MKRLSLPQQEINRVQNLRLVQDLSYGKIEKMTGISKGTVRRIVMGEYHQQKKALAPVCEIHGKVCVKKCRATTKARTPRWRVTPPRCKCGGKVSGGHVIICRECGCIVKAETRKVIQYKY